MKQLVEAIDLVIVDVVEHVCEICLRIDAVILAVSMIVMARARVSAPGRRRQIASFFPIPIGRRARAGALLSMATRPSSRNRQNDGQRLRP